MKRAMERLLVALLILGVPSLTYGLVIRPSQRRLEDLRQRIQKANGESSAFQLFTPVGEEERAFLEDPKAPWRTRLIPVAGDAARLAHMNRVVREVQASLKAKGITALAMRTTWDPFTADFTLPAGVTRRTPRPCPTADAPEIHLDDWVLELDLPGTPGDLFKAMAAVADVNLLLEPVGLRWEAGGSGGEGSAGPRQCLVLRNLYLKP